MARPRATAMQAACGTTVTILAFAAVASSSAWAEPCTQTGVNAIGGTLAAPAKPCPHPSTRPFSVPNQPPQPQPQGQKPGTFQHGNTTIHIGGSISTEVGVGGRR